MDTPLNPDTSSAGAQNSKMERDSKRLEGATSNKRDSATNPKGSFGRSGDKGRSDDSSRETYKEFL